MSEQLLETTYNREQRLYDDTTTWLAEVLDGNMRTPFEYCFDGQELYGRDGSPLKPIFTDAVEHAKSLDPGLDFELRRRLIELGEYESMVAMARGDLPNTMVVISDFPPELMNAIENVGGYNVNRKQTMLRVISKSEDGRIMMRSQSLDLSDRQALENLYYELGHTPDEGELLGQRMHLDLAAEEQEFLIDHLMGVYDRTLAGKYGGEWHAGRQGSRINTYDFVLNQSDLVDSFLLDVSQINGAHQDLLYNLAAAIRRRFEGQQIITHREQLTSSMVIDPRMEMYIAGAVARSEGKSFTGCGLTLKSSDMPATQGELEQLGYGNASEADEDKFGPLKFTCQKGHWNIRPRNHLIDRCKTCGISVKC